MNSTFLSQILRKFSCAVCDINSKMKKLRPILAASVLVLTIQLLLFSTCKRYRPENDDLAKYQFVNTAGICSGSVVSGQYLAGVSLASDNVIKVQINVTNVGQYTITTTKLNGMQFSATGKFTSTGMHPVVLQGAGKPATKGIFTFNTSGTAGCEFNVVVGEKPIDYSVYTVYESDLVCQQPLLHGRLIKGVPLSVEDRLIFSIHVTAPGAFVIYTDSINGIYFSATGNFTTTGDQTVILHGFGTPTDAGNFYFNLHAGNGSCSFAVTCTVS